MMIPALAAGKPSTVIMIPAQAEQSAPNAARIAAAVPNEQLLSKYTFLVPDKFQSQLTVIRPEGARVMFDGMMMPDSLFVSSGGGFEVGRIDFDRDACVTCGRCVTACPTSAIGNPTVGSGALERQITSLVAGASPEPLGIAFVCQQRTRPVASAGWAEVELPCTGMVPATWPIAALIMSGLRCRSWSSVAQP